MSSRNSDYGNEMNAMMAPSTSLAMDSSMQNITLSDAEMKDYMSYQDNIKSLYDYAIETASSYQRHRPMMPTIIYPWFAITKTLGLDNSGVLSISGLLLLSWIDPRICWNTDRFNLTQINIPSRSMWYPPLNLWNSGSMSLVVTPGPLSTSSVTFDGHVTMYIPTVFTSTCTLNLVNFPFDTQQCTLILMSLDADTYKPGVNFTVINDQMYSAQFYSKTGEFDLVNGSLSVGPEVCLTACYSTFIITLNYSRRSAYYTMSVIIPALFITFLLALTFIIPSENSVKLSIGCTLMVSLYTLQQTVSRILPATLNPPLLATGMMCSLALAVFCSVCSIFNLFGRLIQPLLAQACARCHDDPSYECCDCGYGYGCGNVCDKNRIADAGNIKFQTTVHKPHLRLQLPTLTTNVDSKCKVTDFDNDSSTALLVNHFNEQSNVLRDIAANLSKLARATAETTDKRGREAEHNRRWRIVDLSVNSVLLVVYLAMALFCVLSYYF